MPEPHHQDRNDPARASALAHEFRAPLSAMLGLIEELIDDLPDRVDALSVLHIVRDNGEYLLALLGATLDAQQARPRRDLEPLAELRAVAAAMAPAALRKGLDLDVAIAGPLPEQIAVDALRVRQILFNLLGNAIAHTAAGGIRVELAAEDGALRCTVIDSGPGLPPGLGERAFEAFVSGTPGGTGLGLYVSRRLATGLGGELTLTSSSPAGCRFDLRLPYPDATPLIAAGDPRLAAVAGRYSERGERTARPRSILVVAGRNDRGLLLTALGKQLGCDTVLATDDATASTELARRRRLGSDFDLVLLAAATPSIARDTLAALRAVDATTPVLIVGTHLDEIDAATRCIADDGTPESIRRTIRAALGDAAGTPPAPPHR